jgi:hypothetical protein
MILLMRLDLSTGAHNVFRGNHAKTSITRTFQEIEFHRFVCEPFKRQYFWRLAQTRARHEAKGCEQTAEQSRREQASAPARSSAWTGVITYTRTQSMKDNKTIKRVSGRGEDKRDWHMKYDYKAQVAVIEAPEKNGSNFGKANISHTFSSIETTSSTEKIRATTAKRGGI